MNYKWNMSDVVYTKHKGKVFSCFSCGGGSTMGYKLAGYDVIGCNEIDPRMMNIYMANHNPKFSFMEDIRTLKNRVDLPDELFKLDILDGSPPCSSFSMAGERENGWGKNKKFKEGQVKQVLDTLFFDFIDLGKRLQPKVIVAENVTGILLGKAKQYVREIYKQLDDAGYYCQHFIVNSKDMGVPQRRERVFFIGLRKDLAEKFNSQTDLFTHLPRLNLSFNLPERCFGDVQESHTNRTPISPSYVKYWENTNYHGKYDQRSNGGITFGYFRTAVKHMPVCCIMTNNTIAIEEQPLKITNNELILCSSFPMDYDFMDQDVQYVVGMSVPPLMIKGISEEIYTQWLSKL